MTTAAQALAGFRASSAGGQIIGYCYAPGAARWFALDATGAACGPGGPLGLAGVFEVRATDGNREFRWLQTAPGTGRTAVLAGTPQPVELPRQRRILAGAVISVRSSPAGPWACLFSARYGQAEVPVDASPGDRIGIESAEHVSEDAHGNLTVTDARWTGLRRIGDDRD